MSSNSNSSSMSPPRIPPHIRLNSAQEDLLLNDNTRSPTAGASRSLIPTSVPIHSQPSQPSLYTSPSLLESQERLLPPTRSKSHRLRDDDSPIKSPDHSAFPSRRTSWSSDRSRDSRGYENPFSDRARAPSAFESRGDSDDENVNTQTVSEKYNILPSAGLLLFPEDVEKDDYLHTPDPSGKEERDCDIFTRRGIVNVGGLALIVLGLMVLFIGYPVLTFAQRYIKPDPCKSNPDCIKVGKIPLLKNVRRTLIDPDTPKSAMTKKDYHGNTWNLVFSDEFSSPGRTFYDGDDPYWQAMDFWYGVTQDLEWYDPDAATTNNGVLELRFDAFQNHGLNYRSGMLQSWNKMCFKGGRLEASISLPGRGDTIGFWPGFWAMGNLGRAGYAATTDGMWPYSYDDNCDAGITPNQSSSDGLSQLPGMRLPACTCQGADHPSPGKSRSAPELDVIEASVHAVDPQGNQVGTVSQTFQVAPFDIWYQPNTEFMEVFDRSITTINSYLGGPYQQALSALSNVNNEWYDGQAYQKYAFEYTPGAAGDAIFFVGDDATYRITGDAIGPNGNVGQRVLPQEPMYAIANFGMSTGFSALNLTGIAPLLPATMRFDYIRVYQDSSAESVTCDPPGYETTSYIAQHFDAYANPNLTLWSQTKYDWPKNKLLYDC